MGHESDWDVKITRGNTSRKFRLLNTREGKSWTVREVPMNFTLDSSVPEEGERLLPFEMRDWSWGTGLDKFTPQSTRPGHRLRYFDGQNIDTSEPGIIRHGPEVTNVGSSLAENPIEALVFKDKVWFLTPSRLYNWNGTTLTEFWSGGGGANKHMEVFNNNLYVAQGANYVHTDGVAAPTSHTDNADFFLALGKRMWRAYDTNQIASTEDPSVSLPTWANTFTAGEGDAITNLFSISGLLGFCTQSGLYIRDSDNESVELHKLLRTRRSANAFSRKSESGSDAWFSDGKTALRLTAEGFEIFDIRLDGPFHHIDERPINVNFSMQPQVGYISQDLESVYLIASRADVAGFFIYKGVEINRGLFAWSPIAAFSGSAPNFIHVAKLTSDTHPHVYFNSGTQLKRFSTHWSTYAPSWELITPRYDASQESISKIWYKLRAFLKKDTNAQVTVHYRLNNSTTWSLFGPTGIMNSDGNNEILIVDSPASGKSIQLRFTGTTTSNTHRVDLLSFVLEGLLRPDLQRIFDFIVVVENKGESDFLYNLRTDSTQFIQVEDRFGISRSAFIIPGFPSEQELFDEVRKEPMRAYRIVAQEVS